MARLRHIAALLALLVALAGPVAASCGCQGGPGAGVVNNADAPRCGADLGAQGRGAEDAAEYRLLYFDVKGAAEPIRNLLRLARQPFDDVRFAPAGPDPASPAPGSKPHYASLGQLDANLARAPVLFVGGRSIGQSGAVARFVARKFNLMGSDEVEAAQCDAVWEHVKDIKADYRAAWAGKGDGMPAAKAAWIAEKLPVWLGKVDRALDGTSGFAVGSKLSLADVILANFLFDHFDDVEGVLRAAEGAPRVLASAKKAREALAALDAPEA
ncbi:hypothetical protein DFJ74DRAFT_693807 [Hyaloraphidium curvatum]|nr:hypothetical protein DFJ74DRAFT_693807 [Hyaloraphidium curvatum]